MDQQQLLFFLGIVALAAMTIIRILRKKGRKKLVAEKLAGGAKIVDVRTAGEFGSGHYPGAVNIPLDKLPNKMKKLGSKDSTIVVYCATGSRSRAAVSRIKAAGYNDVLNGGALSDLPRR